MKRGSLFILKILLISLVSIYLVHAYDNSCNKDDDCKLEVPSKLAECLPCDPYGCQIYDVKSEEVITVNKNWSPFCPEVNKSEQICAACTGGFSGEYLLKCINKKCFKITTTNSSVPAHIAQIINRTLKIMPDTASSIAIARLGLKVCNESNNCTIVLKDTGIRNEATNETQLKYVITALKDRRFLWWHWKKPVQVEINAETGEVS